MGLVSSKTLLEEAYAHKYAVGGFGIPTFEFAEAVIAAATETRTPVIVNIPEGQFTEKGFENICHAVIDLIERQDIPIGIHLDHGKNFNSAQKAIKFGINSVLIDYSEESFEKNVRLTKRVVEYAHAHNTTVEGELGRMSGGDGLTAPAKADEKGFTDPAQVEEFLEKTGVDFLSVSVGTVHGKYSETPRIDYNRLEMINEKAEIPLIFHGGSGTPCDMLQKAIAHGIAKIHIYNDMLQAATESVRAELAVSPDRLIVPDILQDAMTRVKEVVEGKIICFSKNVSA